MECLWMVGLFGWKKPEELDGLVDEQDVVADVIKTQSRKSQARGVVLSCEDPVQAHPYALEREVEYEDRITLFISTGSLELRNVARTDTGEYSVNIVAGGGSPAENGQTSLTVYDPVSNVTVTVSSSDLVEFNSSVTLSCSADGTSITTFTWFNGSSEVTASDRVHLTDGGATLTIDPVWRYDQGPFTCEVSNPVSSSTSDPVVLSINYGPHDVIVRTSPSDYCEEGSDVLMSCSADSRPAAQFKWLLNGELLSFTGAQFELKNIQMNQSGNYSCQAFNSKTLRSTTSQPASISVLNIVTNPSVTVSSTDLIENSPLSFSCSAYGSSLSFLWFNGSSEVTASDRVHLTDGGTTLTIDTVSRYDQGPFTCEASNSVSSSTSDPVVLSISYGPDDVILRTSPSDYCEEGSDVLMSCSADSRPAAQFKWLLNGELLSFTGAQFELKNIQMNQSGNYSCQAFNSKTLRSTTSQPASISVLKRITNIYVESSSNEPIEGTSLNLTCDASGSIFNRKWLINEQDLKPSENVVFHEQKRVLSFKVLNRKDSGSYVCEINNPINNQTAVYSLTVNYGPENVKISGPTEVQVDKTITLTCFSDSVPTADYTWIKNETIIAQSSKYIKTITGTADEGEYICRASNDITNKTSEASHSVLVLTDVPQEGLTAGAIAGITVASLVIVAGAAAGGFYLYKQKKGRKLSKNSPKELHVYENASNTQNFNTDEKHVYENDVNLYDRNL
ncbi:hypothetical protein WMY93_026473 [Mugilogobius chulae]|uniref:Ig-like domain-containing protein n=1 Tax=Mugilogobius chulae TaxID=88201 RepID=A0AAW0N4D0_9GOBI